MKHKLTKEQNAILGFITPGCRLIISALAGSGKTSTLMAILPKLKNAAIVAFNKSIAEELKAKIEANDLSKHGKAGTVHSFGWWLLKKHITGKKNPYTIKGMWKMVNIFTAMGVPEKWEWFLASVVSKAKNEAWGLAGGLSDSMESLEYLFDRYTFDNAPREFEMSDVLEWLRKGLDKSNEESRKGQFDFDDMVYVPLAFNLMPNSYDYVLVDEAQDLNNARRLFAYGLMKKDGGFIAVGDPNQAIYGFTGANYDSLDLIKKEMGCQVLPLTTCFRCSQAVIREAQEVVPEIQAAPTAVEGLIEHIAQAQFTERENSFTGNDALICRNNAPLTKVAYSLIRKGVRCVIEGTDIGKGLVIFAKSFKTESLQALIEKLAEYQNEQETVLMAKPGGAYRFEALKDKCETLLILIAGTIERGGSTVKDLENFISSLFADSKGEKRDCLTLSTIHKAKGREWENVMFLNRQLIPSRYAVTQEQLQQERNLDYVARTRAKHTLSYLALD